jgi:hypothetical protein
MTALVSSNAFRGFVVIVSWLCWAPNIMFAEYLIGAANPNR